MKIAILHEMFVKLGGAEKVVESWMELFPDAELFTLMYDEEKCSSFFPKEKFNKQVFNLSSQKRYSWTKKQRLSINLMARSIEALDFSGYDLVLCSSSGFAHGAITKPETKFVVYYHSPAGYLWHQTNEYKSMIGFDKGIKGYFLNKFFNKTRIWDFVASARVDIPLIASKIAGKRIKKYYNRNDYKVIYPPVEINRFLNSPKIYKTKDYYITISALTEWKKIDLLVESFNKMPDKKLKIIGTGNQEEKLKKLANKNIEFIGYKSGKELEQIIGESLGGIFCGVEDFGIAAVECMAAGKAIFGIKAGGITETSLKGITGEFYNQQTKDSFINSFEKFDKNIKSGKYKIEDCQNRAKLFSKENHQKQILEICEKK